MYMLFLTIAIALSSGIGFFAAYDTEQRVNGRSIEMRAETDFVIQEQMKRALRRQAQINPGLLPAPNPNGLVEIPNRIVMETLFGGLRVTTDAIYYVDKDGSIVSHMVDQEPYPVVKNALNPTGPVNVSPGSSKSQQETPEVFVDIALRSGDAP